MTKPPRRAALVQRLADFVLQEGLQAASLRPLARAAGTSDRMLLYYFTDKTDLITAILAEIARRLRDALDREMAGPPLPEPQLLPALFAAAVSPPVWPYIRVWLELAAHAARGDAALGGIGRAIGAGFLDWIAAHLQAEPAARGDQAARLLVRMEGMLVLHALGLGDIARRALD